MQISKTLKIDPNFVRAAVTVMIALGVLETCNFNFIKIK